MKQQRIIVGLSGGVDSAVTALLLQRQGYDVRAVFMKNWSEDDFGGPCPWAEDQASASAVANHLHLPLEIWNFEREYRAKVFDTMIAEYRQGRTPNPDILCNREIKFDLFLKKALESSDAVATGHYAQTRDGKLLKGSDESKDQSYFLAAVPSEALRHVVFPIGAMRKDEVRKLAREAKLPNWDRPDSVGICFVGEKKMTDFLRKYIPDQPGNIMTADGIVIGRHAGLHQFTIGQRHGFGHMLDWAALKKRGVPSGQPLMVTKKDLAHNHLIVAPAEEFRRQSKKELSTETPHWIDEPTLPWRGSVKLRYRQPDLPCTVATRGPGLIVSLNEPQTAITPGQYAVFYDGDECLGSAVIA